VLVGSLRCPGRVPVCRVVVCRHSRGPGRGFVSGFVGFRHHRCLVGGSVGRFGLGLR
jgi:hypothetical protein